MLGTTITIQHNHHHQSTPASPANITTIISQHHYHHQLKYTLISQHNITTIAVKTTTTTQVGCTHRLSSRHITLGHPTTTQVACTHRLSSRHITLGHQPPFIIADLTLNMSHSPPSNHSVEPLLTNTIQGIRCGR